MTRREIERRLRRLEALLGGPCPECARLSELPQLRAAAGEVLESNWSAPATCPRCNAPALECKVLVDLDGNAA